ncbi:ATP-binding cassette domain-containing protein [Nocardiopsis sp. JB363]|uniref:ATP-binding cassette domain-containing protein n=1 Tax=Nocardiopsis sp. JB363 TaxID=1434837 RepID=UPI00097A0F21|nr:ATP-binding cassette domain-containing protein [Nocardiopsis sp. JB363]SIO89844.1 Molybdenum transport ATP-binding protein ModC (TC 3.A.1.8.1) [Nocardiopsis sp. JB363]
MPPRGAGIRITALSCTHGSVRAVADVDLEVEADTRVALVGTNGSGKSTLLRAVLGLHRDTGGTIAVDGHVARTGRDWTRRRRECAWIPQRQSPGSFPLLVRELLDGPGGHPAARDAARDLGVGTLLERPVSTLSGGQFQRVHLARIAGSVADGARVVLADEPTAALDFEARAEARSYLLGLGVTVLVVTHDPDLAAACDRRLEMAAGSLREVA